MSNISKFRVDGVEYDVGASSGGLVGYSGTTNTLFEVGLKDDGTITTTYNETDKYVCLIVYLPLNYYIAETTNVEYEVVGSYVFVRPTADNWNIVVGGGSND